MKKLKRSFKKLNKDIKKHTNSINRGGCVHFAYFLSKKLRSLKIEHSIVFGSWEPIPGVKHLNTVTHIMVHIEGIGYIDGTDIFKKVSSKYKYVKIVKAATLPLKKFERYCWIYGWNPQYNTDQNVLVANFIDTYIQ